MAGERDGQLAPPSESVHLPGPSYLPVVVAGATTVALVGIVLSWVVFGIGLLVVLIAVVRWVRQTRTEIAQLPLEH